MLTTDHPAIVRADGHDPAACPVCEYLAAEAPRLPCPVTRVPRLAQLFLADPETYRPIVLARARGMAGVPASAAAPTPASAFADVPRLDEWSYVTTGRLVEDVARLMEQLPPDIDAIVAIPRSGLLPGSLLSHHLHLPLWTLSRQRGVSWPGQGLRLSPLGTDPKDAAEPDRAAIRHVAIVDDSVARGHEMAAALPVARAAFPGARITRAVVYAHPMGLHAIDRCAAVYPGLHYLDWNWPNAGHGALCAYDFDGILCRDFTPAESASMDAYRAAMERMPPRYLPRRLPIPLIVTGRHESTRDVTEAWLEKWGVRVEKLVMWPGEPHPPASEVAPWKARHYAESRCILFAESDPGQAETISRLTGKPVICPALGRVFPARDGVQPRFPGETPAPDPASLARRAEIAETHRLRAAALACPERRPEPG